MQGSPVIFKIKVTPNAKKEHVKPVHMDDGSVLYRVYVNAAPEKGKANDAVVKMIAAFLDLPRSSIKVTRGHKSRDKEITVNR